MADETGIDATGGEIHVQLTPEKQENPTMLRSNDRPRILTFIHNVDLPRWRAMDAEEKKTWTAFNLRYMVRHLDRLAAQLPKEG